MSILPISNGVEIVENSINCKRHDKPQRDVEKLTRSINPQCEMEEHQHRHSLSHMFIIWQSEMNKSIVDSQKCSQCFVFSERAWTFVGVKRKTEKPIKKVGNGISEKYLTAKAI